MPKNQKKNSRKTELKKRADRIGESTYRKDEEEMNNIYPKCMICGKNPEQGLHDGLWLYRKFICSNCENSLISVEEQKDYDHTINVIKAILFGHRLQSKKCMLK
ncbi:Sigma-G inhibitor, Gin [Syntrophobotulus glycolicus DSM 8271]|uniref:Sigma-G inhibitor, Gin n=1 Tax=Syntrophobotulus glycolicus (strain DSM 8271 / FlGlyR) TaxID=645991 RepID=F0SW52_SYNGF|nr:sigma-G inhibitor, Gin [Syntrophobotulus glycolicus]ADY54538.1 Sigma-G inhibitor, Gin [Syntrophobotulus glycolicus DSM 8271]